MGLYSLHHTLFVVLFAVILAAAVLVYKLALKTDRARDIFIRCLGGALFISLVINRIALTLWNNNGIGVREMIPNTYCGMSSLILGLAVAFGKPNLKIFQFLFYLELFGGLACVFYPTFLLQGPSFFFFPTITGMNHHALGAILCIILAVSGWFKPSLKDWYVFPLGICAYTVFGLFLLDVLHIRHTMIIDEPIIGGTPFKWWFVLLVGTPLIAAISLGYEKITARVKKSAAPSEEIYGEAAITQSDED